MNLSEGSLKSRVPSRSSPVQKLQGHRRRHQTAGVLTLTKMPIGSQAKSRPSAAAPPTASSTAFVANRPKLTNEALVVVPDRSDNEALPSYEESENQENIPKTLLPPSSDHDLEYFDAVASGRPCKTPPYSTRLVLHFYRNTQTHIFPVEERVALGSLLKSPFYVLKASPSLSSADEYNKLTITRWQPSTGVRHHAAISEILPRLKLLAKGTMTISKIFLAENPDEYELWWDSERSTYTIWKNKMPELDVDCEGWVSLDDKPQKGMLVVGFLDTYFGRDQLTIETGQEHLSQR
jgi:hypothetical protein